jgi:hypothetical protein
MNPELKKHLNWLQWRLRVFTGKRIMWSQDDAAAISALCIYVKEQIHSVGEKSALPDCGFQYHHSSDLSASEQVEEFNKNEVEETEEAK